MRGAFVFYDEEEPDGSSHLDEVEELARARRCPCGKLIRGLRALHGRATCSGACKAKFTADTSRQTSKE